MPSYHVWSDFPFPSLPHFPNQEPPWPQQLLLPVFAMFPHLRHAELVIFVVCAGVHMGVSVNKYIENPITFNAKIYLRARTWR